MKKKMKAILSLVLAFVLTIGSVNAADLFTKSVDKVNAADLTEISWTDFGLTNGTTTTGQTYSYNGTDLNNTSFEGDISISEGNGFHYGSNNGWYGMEIRVSDGKLQLVGSGGVKVKGSDKVVSTYDAKDYGMDTFADTRFTLKIEMYNLSADKRSATVNIYINNICVENEIALAAETNVAYSIDNKIGFANINGSEGTLKHITVYDVKPELKKITWTDFTYLSNGKTINTAMSPTYTGGDTLNNTSFEGDIAFAAGSGFRYATGNAWFGLTIQESNGNLVIGGGQGVTITGAQTCQASDYGLDTFTNKRITLRIDLYDVSENKQSAHFHIFINGKQVANEITFGALSTEYYGIGTQMSFGQGDPALGMGMTVYKTKPTLQEISWSDFGLENGTTTNSETYKFKNDTLNNTSFKGDLSISEGHGFRYASANGHFGLTFKVENGNLWIGGSTGVSVNGKGVANKAYECTPSEYDMNTFADQRFTLQINMYDVASDGSTANVDIYVNNKNICENCLIEADSNNLDAFGVSNKLGFASWFNAGKANITVYKTKPTFKEITWENFTSNGVPLANGQTITSDCLYAYSETTLNNTAFTGDVSIPEGGGFRYAVPTSWHGFTFKVSNAGQLIIEGSGGTFKVNNVASESYKLDAKDYKLQDTFVNKRFTVRIEFYELAEDNLSARVNIYINGKTVGEDILLSGSNTAPAFALDKKIGFCQNGIENGCTVYEASDIKPELTEIGWADFGATYNNTYAKGAETHSTYLQATNLKDLSNTKFKGNVSFADNTTVNYGGKYWNTGLSLQVANGTFKISGYGITFKTTPEITITEENTADYDLTSFVDTPFLLEIAFTEYTDKKTTVDVSINGHPLDTITLESQNSTEGMFVLGTKLSVVEGAITPVNTIAVPTDLTSLSWEEFGYTGGIATTNSVTRAASHLENLNGTLFNGDVMMQSGREIRYAENADTNAGGVSVKVNVDGTLTASVVNSGSAVKSYTVSGAYYGVDTFINTKFNLKIAVMTENQIGVWVNDIIVGDLFATEAQNLTLGTTLYMVNTEITPISSRTTVPTGLTSISFDDWTADDKDKVSADAKLKNGELSGTKTTVTSLIGTSLYEVVKFVDTNGTDGKHMFVYGGAQSNTWLGIRIFLENGKMRITSDVLVNETWVTHGAFTIDPQTAGVGDSFKDTEFSWQIDTVQVGKHILLYMSFDGQLYNNAPFVFYDFAEDISNAMYYTTYEGTDATDKVNNCWTVLGPATKTLTTLYHDLDKGDYTVPTGTTTFYTKSQAGEWTKINNPTKISAKGDYKVEFNDGVSGYIQEVVCYHYQSDVDVTVLVRALKMKDNQTDSSWFDYEKRLCDKNYDDKVDADDVKTIKEMLLGTYKKETEMKISGFFSPTASLVKDETYATIKSTGVNHIIETNVSYTDDALTRYRTYQELSFAQKYGMTVTVKDGRLTAIGESNGTATATDVQNYVANYKDYQSFSGLFIIDEPKAEAFPNTGEWKGVKQVEEYSSVAKAIAAAGYEGWSNAFGGSTDFFNNSWKYNGSSMRYRYYNYLSTLVEKFDLSFVSFTFYPFWDEYDGKSKGVDSAKNYFMNLAMAKDIANKKNISFRNFVQAGEGFEEEPNNNFTEAQFKWNANINLAFGTSALEYFPLVHPASLKNYADGTCASGLLDGDGKLTKFGEWATSVNKQAAAVDEILLNATNEGYMSTGGYAKSVATETVGKIEMWENATSKKTITNTIHTSYNSATVTSNDSTYGAFTGCFKITSGEYAGKSAMYIVNYNDTAANNITVNFGSSKEVTTIYQGVKTTQNASTYTSSIAAGDAVLVIY